MTTLKSLIIAGVIHVLLFSLIWVGFPVLIPRNGVVFYYAGSSGMAEELSQEHMLNKPAGQQVTITTTDPSSFGPWIKSRSLDKPKR